MRKKTKFEEELEILINKHSMENSSNTPDFVLAKYLISCLANFNTALIEREMFYGRNIKQTNLNLSV